MNIIWLEDELETIEGIYNDILEYCVTLVPCKCFASFSDEIDDENFEDIRSNIIIIDIQMLFNIENNFTCFNETFKIHNKNYSGFEYFNYCIQDRFKNVTIIFYSSNSLEQATKDAKKYNIEKAYIVSKESSTDLLNIIKDIQCNL